MSLVTLSALVALLLANYVEQATAMALVGWQDPNHNATLGAVDKRAFSAFVMPAKIVTIYSTGDVTKRKTAGFGFNFEVDYRNNLWGFCRGSSDEDLSECIVGKCFDDSECSTGCALATDTTLSTLSCTAENAPICSTMLLVPQSGVPNTATYVTCGEGESTDVYYAFSVDLPPTETTSTKASPSTSTTQAASASKQTPEPGPAITTGPKQSDGPSGTDSAPGSSQTDAQPNAGTASNNMGAIVGGAIGGLALICGSGLAIVWLLRRNKSAAAKSTASSGDGTEYLGKPELAAYEKERAELFGQSLSEMSAQTPAAYDTSSYRPQYPPMTPVEMADTSAWKVR